MPGLTVKRGADCAVAAQDDMRTVSQLQVFDLGNGGQVLGLQAHRHIGHPAGTEHQQYGSGGGQVLAHWASPGALDRRGWQPQIDFQALQSLLERAVVPQCF
ncbi:hypothetical protein D3C79_867840 [compost metagenome]